MKINFKKELEEAARTMILVHKPSTLIKLILRMLVRKLKLSHAGILLYERHRNSYILTMTGGQVGTRIPAGFIRLDASSPIIRFFADPKRYVNFTQRGALLLSRVNSLLKERELFVGNEDFEKLLLAIKFQLKSFDAVICVPSYFHDHLLGILMLGDKVNRKRFKREEIDFFNALANDVAMALRNAFIFEDLQLEIEHGKKLFFETTMALSAAIDAKDHYTRGHTGRVTEYGLSIAKSLAAEPDGDLRFSDGVMENLHIASLLHDIGKIGIPESILNKKGPLTPEERKKINEHSLIGAMILEPIEALEDVILGVRHHHERFDGNGYPEGLKGDDIPLISSIIAVADSFDAMISDRPYRSALTREAALDEVARCCGTQFDPRIAKEALKIFKKGDA